MHRRGQQPAPSGENVWHGIKSGRALRLGLCNGKGFYRVSDGAPGGKNRADEGALRRDCIDCSISSGRSDGGKLLCRAGLCILRGRWDGCAGYGLSRAFKRGV